MVELRKTRRAGEYTAEVDGGELTFSWRKPQTKSVLGIMPTSMAIEARGQRFMIDRQKHIVGDLDKAPALRIEGEEVDEVYRFICVHVVKLEGLTVDDESVTWSELSDEDQESVLDLIGWGQCQTLFGEMLESAGFSPAKKKESVESLS